MEGACALCPVNMGCRQCNLTSFLNQTWIIDINRYIHDYIGPMVCILLCTLHGQSKPEQQGILSLKEVTDLVKYADRGRDIGVKIKHEKWNKEVTSHLDDQESSCFFVLSGWRQFGDSEEASLAEITWHSPISHKSSWRRRMTLMKTTLHSSKPSGPLPKSSLPACMPPP